MEIKGMYFYLQSYYPSRTDDCGTQNEESLESRGNYYKDQLMEHCHRWTQTAFSSLNPFQMAVFILNLPQSLYPATLAIKL